MMLLHILWAWNALLCVYLSLYSIQVHNEVSIHHKLSFSIINRHGWFFFYANLYIVEHSKISRLSCIKKIYLHPEFCTIHVDSSMFAHSPGINVDVVE